MDKKKLPTSDSGYFLRNLMDHLPDPIYFKDLESHFVIVNEACLKKQGWASLEDIIGKTDFDVFSREHAEQAFADEQKIIKTGKPLDGIEEKETWPDGRVSWVSTKKMPLKNSRGEIIGTFGISRDITMRKENEIRAQRYADEIREIKEGMEDDVHMASELQKTFFPETYPVYPEGAAASDQCVEFLHQFKSYGDISGDYCSIQRLSKTHAGIFLCDVHGIGLRAALGTALIRGVVQEISSLALDPGAYLTRMNELLAPLLRQDGIPLDVKACYVVLDVETGCMQMANAGHLQALLMASNGTVRKLQEGQGLENPALAMESNAVYETIEYTVTAGDRVILFTDGLCSATNKAGHFYGEQRLIDSASAHAAEPLEALFQWIETDAHTFSCSDSFSDDFCLVGFHINHLLK